MARPEKVTVVDEIAEKIERTQSLYLTDFTGLDVETINELRRLLRDNKVEYRVVKNTLARLAADKVGREDIKPYLIGPTAMAFGYEDPVLPAKLISRFAQRTGKPEVKAILIEGRLFEKEALDRLRTLPSREELLAKMLAGLKSPITCTVMVLKGMLRNLVELLDAISRSKRDQSAQEEDTAQLPKDDALEELQEADQDGRPTIEAAEATSGQGDSTPTEKDKEGSSCPEKRPDEAE